MLELILVLAVLVGVLGFVLWPLLGDTGRTVETAAVETAGSGAVSREELEEALADLEYDRGAGKISLEDYERHRQELVTRLHALTPAR
jgi:cytochrome c-type biogenesis protein CcmI